MIKHHITLKADTTKFKKAMRECRKILGDLHYWNFQMLILEGIIVPTDKEYLA